MWCLQNLGYMMMYDYSSIDKHINDSLRIAKRQDDHYNNYTTC